MQHGGGPSGIPGEMCESESCLATHQRRTSGSWEALRGNARDLGGKLEWSLGAQLQCLVVWKWHLWGIPAALSSGDPESAQFTLLSSCSHSLSPSAARRLDTRGRPRPSCSNPLGHHLTQAKSHSPYQACKAPQDQPCHLSTPPPPPLPSSLCFSPETS